MRFMVTPAVCPRLFEYHTTLKFGALRKTRIVSTAFETIARKKKGNLVVHMWSAMYHESSRTQPQLEENVVWKKTKSRVYDGSQKKKKDDIW